jgi:hypothetical protein
MRLEPGLAVITLAGCLAGAAGAAEHPDLSGTWSFNEEQSQNLVAKIAAATGGDQARSSPELGRLREQLMTLARRGETIEIEQAADQVQMAYPNDDVRIFYPGREHVRQTPGGGKIRAVPRWEGESLVVEQALPDGAKSIETFSLEAEGRQLVVLLRLEAKRLKDMLTARLVYDRAEAAAGASPRR